MKECSERARLPLLLISGNDMHRNVACFGVVLQAIEHRPTLLVRQLDVQGYRVRLMFARQRKSDIPTRSNQSLEALLVRKIQNDLGKERVVFDYQHYPLAWLYLAAIVLNLENLVVLDGGVGVS